MSINSSYDYLNNEQGNAHFYYAQYKNNRMREWQYLRDSGSYEVILQGIEDAKERAKKLVETGEKYYKSHYKTMKYRVLKVDIELLPIV
jgi:hypothetical protein